jgi:hypothetical protein
MRADAVLGGHEALLLEAGEHLAELDRDGDPALVIDRMLEVAPEHPTDCGAYRSTGHFPDGRGPFPVSEPGYCPGGLEGKGFLPCGRGKARVSRPRRACLTAPREPSRHSGQADTSLTATETERWLNVGRAAAGQGDARSLLATVVRLARGRSVDGTALVPAFQGLQRGRQNARRRMQGVVHLGLPYCKREPKI